MLRNALTGKNTPSKPERNRPQVAVVVMLAFVSLLVILPFVYTGTFSRYLADDYCFSRQVIENGFWGAQQHSYVTWSDRFSTTFITSLLDYIGVTGMRILPGVLVVGFLAGVFCLFRRIRSLFNPGLNGFEIFNLAGLTTFITLYTAPDIFQAIYWRAGSITYSLPVVILPFLMLVLLSNIKPKINWGLSVLIFLLFGVNGGFSETTLAFQMALLVIIGLAVQFKVKDQVIRKSLLVHLAVGLAGSSVALAIMFLAPGNAARMTSMPEHPTVFWLIYLSIRYGLGFVYQSVESFPLPIAMAAVIPFCLSLLQERTLSDPKRWYWLFWAIPVTVFGLIVACCVPSAYVQSAYPENRALMAARWIMMVGLVGWSYLLGVVYLQYRNQNPKFQFKKASTNSTFVIVIGMLYLMYAGLQVLSLAPGYEQRALAWDKRAAEIGAMKLAGKTDLQVTALDGMDRIREVTDNSSHWVNKCAAVYYGVDTITAK